MHLFVGVVVRLGKLVAQARTVFASVQPELEVHLSGLVKSIKYILCLADEPTVCSLAETQLIFLWDISVFLKICKFLFNGV